jgi:hypothetical protein
VIDMNVNKMVVACVAAFLLSLPAYADVTLKQTTTGKGLGMSGKSSVVNYIKGAKMRTDTVVGNRTLTTILDVDGQKMYSFDSKKKEADVWDMASVAEDVAEAIDVSAMKVSLTPNGQTKQVAGQKADGYQLQISVPATMGGSKDKDLEMMVTLAGPVWIVKNAPGARDYIGFYKAAAEKGWIFSDPRAAKGQPGQAKAMAEMYRQMAEIGGVPYETDIEIKMSGGGPMGGILGRMGGVSFATTVESVDTGGLSADLFAPPAGYKLKEKK